MAEEENILKLILEKESWEEILYYIVNLEKLNPWNIDLIKLSDGFIKFIKSAEDLDFRIPAKIIFVAAILLKLKADYLSIFETEEDVKEVLKESKPFEELGIDPNLIQLGYAIKRVPKRQITLIELINSLKKALAVYAKKEVRRKFLREQIQAEVAMEEDIIVKIERVMKKIDDMLKKLGVEKIEFRKIVDRWTREEIVNHFVPLLHLEQDQKIKTEQSEFFKEIWISRKN
ncbi:MAG: segregation/condensation protein A [Candidatus Aenigmatarchaeota archaeon]